MKYNKKTDGSVFLLLTDGLTQIQCIESVEIHFFLPDVNTDESVLKRCNGNNIKQGW